MEIIHIWETYSNQTIEVRAETIEKAIWAYAHHACVDWKDLESATCYNDSKWVFKFIDEVLTLTKWSNRNDKVWTAEWSVADAGVFL